MKMKSEEERDKWQKYAKNRYGEPLAVVIRRLIEEDMKDSIPREHIKLEELLSVLREENNQNFRTIINRIDRFLLVSTSKTYELSQEIQIMKGLIVNELEKFISKNSDKKITEELIKNLEIVILDIIDNSIGNSL